MRFLRCLSFVLICAVACCSFFSVSACAATVVQYSYNDIVLPKLPEQADCWRILSVDSNGVYRVYFVDNSERDSYTVGSDGSMWVTGDFYTLVDGQWIFQGTSSYGIVVWSERPVYIFQTNKLFLAASEPVVSVIDIPDPFSISDFMSSVGQILTSAVSWVGDVGSTILQQPFLLAFTALPLCGLGIAVFRRLKETV